LQSGEFGATLPSLLSNVSSSLEDNGASSFIGASMHLHANFFWKIRRKSVKPFSKAEGIRRARYKISSKLEVLKRDGVKIVLVENNL
jgi:hypothetical protein